MNLRDIAQLFGRATGSISEGPRRKDYASVRAREIASQASLVPPERQNAVVDKPGRRWRPRPPSQLLFLGAWRSRLSRVGGIPG